MICIVSTKNPCNLRYSGLGQHKGPVGNYTTPQLQLQMQLHYTNCTTSQLQLTTTTPLHHNYNILQLHLQHYNYNYNCTTPHYIQQLWWGDHCNHCNHSRKHNSNHLSVHQWIRSAIRESQQLTLPIGFLFLKLPPPTVLLVSSLITTLIWFLYCMYLYIYIYDIWYMYMWTDPELWTKKHIGANDEFQHQVAWRCQKWMKSQRSQDDRQTMFQSVPSWNVGSGSALKGCFPIWWRLFLTFVCKFMKGDQQDQPKTQRCPSPMENLQISGPPRICNSKIGWLTHGLPLKSPMKSTDPLWSRLHAPNPCRSFSKCGQLPNHWNSHSMSISYFQNNH